MTKCCLIPKIQGWFNIQKTVNIILYTNILKDKKHMTRQIDVKKALDKIQYSFIIKIYKTLNKPRI